MKRFDFRYWLDGHRWSDGVVADLRTERHDEQGFMLVGLIVAIFIVLLVLGIAAPRMAQELKRDREVEAVHRGNQYVRAIQLYYRKSGSYPGTMDALAKGTPVKFLRQQYVDPFTGKSDWRLIHVGEAKTTVKGLFGQPLTGLAPGLGSASGSASSGAIGAGAAGSGSGSAFGGSSGSAFGGSSGSGSPTLGGSSGSGGTSSPSGPGYSNTGGTGAPSAGTPGAGGATTGTDSSGTGSTTGSNSTLGSAAGIASQSGSGFGVGGAPFVGVGIPKEGTSIVVLNEQKSYNTWEFIYDPRIEQLKQAAGLMGGGNQGLGSAGGISSGVGGAGTGTGYGASGSTGFGSSSGSSFGSSGSSFGSSSGSSFGSSPSSGNGSSPSSGTQGTGTTPTTPQQQ
jgi:type II secretory pathway pseudopilin PulG